MIAGPGTVGFDANGIHNLSLSDSNEARAGSILSSFDAAGRLVRQQQARGGEDGDR